MLTSCLCQAVMLVTAVGQMELPGDKIGCAHAKSSARAWSAEQRTISAAPLNGEDTDVLHYHLDIELNPWTEWLGGTNTMTIQSLAAGLSEFRFRLQDVFTISAIEVDGSAAAWQRLDDATISVNLDPPHALDAVFELSVAYEGFPAPPPSGFGSIEFRQRYVGAPEIWTLSEPWFAYTWWPAKDDNFDKTTADLWFTVPDLMVVASNGILQGVDTVGGDQLRYRWKTEYLTTDYLYCIGATNYNTFDATWTYDGGSMPLSFYIYPENDTTSNRNAWLENLEMLDVFSALYGMYPFVDEKYGMCQVGFGGGMEHQTMTSQGGFWEYITAHELAHQWWGDMITCGTWHDIWLNEGFATYSEALWFANEPGGGGMEAYHDWMDTRRPSAVDDSVYVYDASSVNRIFSSNFSYRKAAWVMHMLRHVVGDEPFFDILADYRQAYEYDSAITDDFQAVVESVVGEDMTWFFEEWIYDIGAPAYDYAWRSLQANGQDYVELYVEQDQNASYPTFFMPIDIEVSNGISWSTEVVWNDAAAEHLLFAVPAPIVDLAFDPEVWILATAVQEVGFVEGPPKIVAIDPPPGGERESADLSQITVVFHKDIVADGGDFAVTGLDAGEIPFTFEYNAATWTVTLTPDSPLAADSYTIYVADGVVDSVSGQALDGEIADGMAPQSLPSGDGLPGGSAVTGFTILAAPCGADLNSDGVVDPADLAQLLGSWGACPPEGGCPADLTGEGVVDAADLALLLGQWGPC